MNVIIAVKIKISIVFIGESVANQVDKHIRLTVFGVKTVIKISMLNKCIFTEKIFEK